MRTPTLHALLVADERVERHFRTRALSAIGWAQRRGVAAGAGTLRELWNAPDQYRADGIWGTKLRANLFRWRPDHALDAKGFHGRWPPSMLTRSAASLPWTS